MTILGDTLYLRQQLQSTDLSRKSETEIHTIKQRMKAEWHLLPKEMQQKFITKAADETKCT